MILPYYVRLLCLCLATFFVVHGMVWLVVRGITPGALKFAETMRSRQSSRMLFVLRILPAAMTLFLVAGFCVPSYVLLEPDVASERVSVTCLLAAAMGAAVWVVSLLRGLMAVVRTERHIRRWRRRRTSAVEIGENGESLLVVDEGTAVMAVAGVVSPTLVVSQTVMEALNDGQREAAFRHEEVHRSSRDNLKKLLFLLSPDVLPFIPGLKNLERGWAKFTEWEADDEAVDGSQERALSLASALIKVAKLGVHPAPADLSSLIDGDRDLATRVDRLLREPAYAVKPLRPAEAFARSAALVIGSVTATVLLWPESLGSVHRLLEQLLR
jgi:beta-lactamase regulating signal transducer with metallopeptidase domain